MTDETARVKTWSFRNMLTAAILVALAFLIGFGWQWFEASNARTERDDLRRELTFQEMENRLASAVIQVENESYEGALELMSRFFTGLQSNVAAAPDATRGDLEDILAGRDAVIAALSRSDPDSRELLTRIYIRYQVAMGGPEVGIPVPVPGAADTQSRPDAAGAADTAGAGDAAGGAGRP